MRHRGAADSKQNPRRCNGRCLANDAVLSGLKMEPSGNRLAPVDGIKHPSESIADDPKAVSVIIPAHNAANTIAATLASLAPARSLLVDVVLVDDASEDGTAHAAATAAAELGLPLRIVRVAAHDAAVARNVGIEASIGQWLYFLDADDLHVSGGIDALLHEARQDPETGLVAGAYQRRVDGRLLRIKRPARLVGLRDTNASRYFSGKMRTFPVGSVLISRRAVGTHRFPASVPYDEDTIFFATVLATAEATSISTCVMIYNVSRERGDNRFASRPADRYLRWRHAVEGMKVRGLPRPVVQRRAGILALKIARVHYARGDMKTAKRFLAISAAAPKSLPDRWRHQRYVAKVKLVAWWERLWSKSPRTVQ